ncbi:MAG: SDR family NAD(P)-dependent oxidoreductase [Bacteroidales bacterium]|nr:SDR family NAD(P)-dependent oxidoreductase [Bacteroidales bacterium]
MSYNPFTLENKTILVTGASSGIGKAVAIECSKLGANVIVCGRNEQRLNETLDSLEGTNHTSRIVDFSTNKEIIPLVESLPNLDGVVHCAGFTHTLPFQFVNEVDLTAIMQVNFVAATMLSQSLVKSKKIGKSSSVVFVSSISGVNVTVLGNAMYSASKGAINGIAKSMALDLAPKGIRVNCVTPGMVNTNILHDELVTKEQLAEDMNKYPLKRYGEPQEVAHGIIYLLSDASKWVTGSNLLIDGGYTLL